MPAGPEKGSEWPICTTCSNYIRCSFSNNRLDILDMEAFLLGHLRDQF